jgi:hypothetical protein
MRGEGEMSAMKRIIILGFVFLFLASQTWGQEKCEAPVWKVGDKWTHKDATGATFTNEVLDVKRDLFILKNEETQDVEAIDQKTMNIKYAIGSSGQKIQSTGPRKLNDFPLFVGKKWTDNFTAEGGRFSRQPFNVLCDFKVEGMAEVKIPAGTFKTYVIYQKQGIMAYGGTFSWMRLWYSPEVKRWIKREYEKSNYWALGRRNDAELISYELK